MFKFKKIEVITALGLLLAFFATRLYNIMSLPIFTDEAIYTRWSQIARLDPNWRFISLTDGKQPLFVWINMVFMKFISDPLLSGRLVSVFAGVMTMAGLYFLGRELFNRKVGLIASLLYVIFPFALVYDRMALYDSLVATGAVWSMFFEVLLIKKKRLDIALILGMVLGLSVLTKTSGFLFIYLIPISLLLFEFKDKNKKDLFVRWTVLAIVSAAFAYLYYSVLRLSPFFHIIDEKNTIFVYPVKEWLSHPFLYFMSNLKGMMDWLIRYMTIIALCLVPLSFLIYNKKFFEKSFLFLWFFLPFIALALDGKTLYPRFILFMTMPLLILCALSISEIFSRIKGKTVAVLVFIFFTFLMFRSDFYILTDFAKAPIPRSDLDQYILSWPAGVGVKEAVAFFKKESKNHKIFIGTEGTFGLMPYGLEIYLYNNPNVKIKGFWPISDTLPKEAAAAAKEMPSYFLFYQSCTQCQWIGIAPISWPLKKELQIPKSVGELTVYRVIPQ